MCSTDPRLVNHLEEKTKTKEPNTLTSKSPKIEQEKIESTLLNRDTQVNQLIILTEQKQKKTKHVIIIKQNKASIVHSMFPKREEFQFANVLFRKTAERNRETGSDRVS